MGRMWELGRKRLWSTRMYCPCIHRETGKERKKKRKERKEERKERKKGGDINTANIRFPD
jgi:hypothetical protein